MKKNESPQGVFWYVRAKTDLFGEVGQIVKLTDDKPVVSYASPRGFESVLVPILNQKVDDIKEYPELAEYLQKRRRKRMGSVPAIAARWRMA